MSKGILIIASTIFLSSNIGPAAAFTDTASGFSINPPARFVTMKSRHLRHDVAVSINARNGKPASANSDGVLCKVAYKAAPQNNDLSREQINALVVTPGRKNLMRAAFERIFAVSTTLEFNHQGYKAVEFHATPKFGPNAENARAFISIIETAKGRASFICVTTKEDFAPGLEDFRTIRASMKVPG